MSVAPATSSHQFGKYSLVAKLATGGMAEIFLARLQGAAGFEKLVCIKRILPHLARDEQLVGMFLSEARIAAQISHPNVCQVFELGEIDGSYFIAMEYLEGVPFSCFRRRDMYPEQPDPRLVAGLGVQACEGLHHAHQLKRPDGSPLAVVHRDVSSNNLFATVDGVVKVLDFGIAKVQDASVRTSTGSVKGTYAYMAPEQLRGEAVDRRTDVFAMGIVLWELFARRHLFRRETDFLTFQAITADPIPAVDELRPDIPPELAAVIAQALARDREQRFPTARALGEALTEAVASIGGPLSAAQLSDEIARSFEARLRDQQGLIRIAREGGTLDLTSDLGPAVGHGTAMLTTPVSILSQRGAAAATTVDPDRLEPEIQPPPGPRSRPLAAQPPPGPRSRPLAAQPPPGPRSKTLLAQPLPMPVAPRQRSRLPIILFLVLVALAAGGAAVFFYLKSEQAARPPPADTHIVMLAIDAQVAAPAPDAAVPIDAGAAIVIDAAIDEPPVDAAVMTRPDTRPPRPPPRPPPREPRPVGPPGFITIDSSPVYAVIFIDGKRYGETPLVRIELAPGKHAVRAVSASGTARSLSVTIESGKVAPTRRIEW